MHALILTLTSIICLSLALNTMAQDVSSNQKTVNENSNDNRLIEEILVWGRAIDLIGAADSASEGFVGYSDFSTRPLLRVGELVEIIPGMIATQHSGGGKANQYFLRGINLDHGTDFALSFEGMPSNMRTHAHGQGYLDMNFIIPELVETIEYHKGTYHVKNGDFSAAGSASFTMYSRLNTGFANLIVSSEKYSRAVAANSWDMDSGTLILGGELQFKDGPWENEENIKKYNLLAKYSADINNKPLSLLASYYSSTWNSTDQIPLRALQSGTLNRFGFVDPSTGGQSKRANLIANIKTTTTKYNAFLSYYELNLFSNGTYFLGDPINGDQIEQEDQRWLIGARADYSTAFELRNIATTINAGADFRYDHINKLNLFGTNNRQRFNTIRSDTADEISVGLYISHEINWSTQLRTSIGLRADLFNWDVNALIPDNTGSGSDHLVSPKLGAVYTLTETLEFYANYGKGFHSNDVRAVELSIDPVSGAAAESFDAIVSATGYEAGFRAEPTDTLNYSMSLFYLEFDSELIFVGDAGTTEPNDATERYGIETTIFWQPLDWLTLDLSAAKTKAKFRDAPSGNNKIPDAHDTVVGTGATINLKSGLTGSLRIRHFSDAPLTEDGSVEKGGTTLVNFGLSKKFSHFSLNLDILNIFDSEAHDIEYLYESQLANEAAPVEDIHFHPVEPREFRVTIKYNL